MLFIASLCSMPLQITQTGLSCTTPSITRSKMKHVMKSKILQQMKVLTTAG